MRKASRRGARLLERVGVRYLTARARRESARVDPRVHVLDAAERETLRRIERGAVIKSALAGALSSIVAAAAETWADTFLVPGASDGLLGHGRYWGLVLGVAVGATVLEILFLYRDALVSVQRMAHGAGLSLAEVQPGEASESIAVALARAALEVPSPPERPLGIDPHRESSRLRLFLAAFLYKGKVALSTVLVKLVVRRVLSRALLRWVLPFVGVPVTALWNALVTYRVMREARVRAMGPSAIQELCDRVCAAEQARGQGTMLLRAVASSVVRTQELHPNLHRLLLEVHARVREEPPADLDDTAEFLRRLRALSPVEQAPVLEMLGYAAILDGRLTRLERRLLQAAGSVAGREDYLERVEVQRRRFLAGEPWEA
jgi:hypothetical protein